MKRAAATAALVALALAACDGLLGIHDLESSADAGSEAGPTDARSPDADGGHDAAIDATADATIDATADVAADAPDGAREASPDDAALEDVTASTSCFDDGLDAGGCPSTCGVCPQCGCPDASFCTFDLVNGPTCTSPGTALEGDPCGPAACGWGLSCFLGVCHRPCRGAAGAPCTGGLPSVCEPTIASQSLCMFTCALDSPTSCVLDSGGALEAAAPPGCFYWFPTDLAGDAGATDCVQLTPAVFACLPDGGACLPGEECLSGGSANSCARWCTQTDDVCPGHCVTDGSQGYAPIAVNGTVYGFCF
jgi:hypothetical protein